MSLIIYNIYPRAILYIFFYLPWCVYLQHINVQTWVSMENVEILKKPGVFSDLSGCLRQNFVPLLVWPFLFNGLYLAHDVNI